MCRKIKEVNSLDPKTILNNYWDGKIPVNIKSMLSAIGVHFCDHDLSNLEQALSVNNNDAILGIAFSDGDELGILYSSKIDKDATNYVLAHELAHCCLHMKPSEEFHVELKVSKDLYSGVRGKTLFAGYKESYKEIQADKFAADLLIPTQALSEYIINNTDASIECIARHFHVAKEIVHLKITNLRRQ